jgi:FtsZ-binding cell division protein ZapB
MNTGDLIKVNKLKREISDLREVNRILRCEVSDLRISKGNAREDLSVVRRDNRKLREELIAVRDSREAWKGKYRTLKDNITALLKGLDKQS